VSKMVLIADAFSGFGEFCAQRYVKSMRFMTHIAVALQPWRLFAINCTMQNAQNALLIINY